MIAETSGPARHKPPYPGVRVTCNGNQLVAQHLEARITEGGVFFPITPSTEGGVQRHVIDETHRSFAPNFRCFIKVEEDTPKPRNRP